MTLTLQILDSDEPYKRQMTSYRRTRSAILEGAKALIASVGIQRVNMVEIADASEISRATLYNHFRDKGSVLRALLESEVQRIFQLVDSDMSPAQALMEISRAISSDTALNTMRITDPSLVTQTLARTDDSLWQQVDAGLRNVFGESRVSGIARLWLIGQVLQPLSVEESRKQSQALASVASQ